MKTVNVRDLQKKIKEFVDASQKDRVVLTRHGKPSAILVGVEGEDWETVVQETNAKFWDLIQTRRKQKNISLADMKNRLKLRK
jgi:prevent-host-death family protein